MTDSNVTGKLESKERVLLLAMRQALLIGLGALEDYLGLERSIVPKHKAKEAERTFNSYDEYKQNKLRRTKYE